mgnify:CR=1 FL=1
MAEKGNITDAAKALYISQPSLTAAIKELEKEMNIQIFDRTNKGVHVSKEGDLFLGYARQILEQVYLLEDHYKNEGTRKQEFCISTQHYSFAVNAFVDLIKEYGQNEYDFSLRETQTYEIIEDVARMKSEIGVLYLDSFNEPVIRKLLKTCNLNLCLQPDHIFLSAAVIRWRRRKKFHYMNYRPIHIFRLNRATIIHFIFRKSYSVPKYAKKISASGTVRLFSIY